jgi:hypothetical protein
VKLDVKPELYKLLDLVSYAKVQKQKQLELYNITHAKVA